MTVYDNIIVGAGPGGYHLAATLASRGESVLIIEKDQPGGTCLNRGCIPTKCLVATASAMLSAADAERLGVTIPSATVDFAKAAERMEGVVAELREGVRTVLKDCMFVEGEAVIEPDRVVTVGSFIYHASKRLVIATGSKPAVLPIEGAELAVTSDEVLKLKKLPESVVIIGGGVIGMEFASIFNALGVKTSVIEFCKEILPPFDPEVAKRLRMTLGKRGIDITVGAAVKKIERSDNGRLRIVYEGKRGEATVEAEMAVMAVGRRPVLPEGLAESGIELTPKGFIKVDDMMRTSAEGVYAVGDVNGLLMLAHAAEAQSRVVAEGNPALFDTSRVPSIVFTEPEVAMVGPVPSALEDCTTVKHLYGANGKARAMGKPEGFIKFAIDADGVIKSVSIIGAHAADLIAEATMLVTDGVRLADVPSRYIHAHPSLSEIF